MNRIVQYITPLKKPILKENVRRTFSPPLNLYLFFFVKQDSESLCYKYCHNTGFNFNELYSIAQYLKLAYSHVGNIKK